jgi:uncharacterized membrane protein YeaQ/YmgE (transglycosylase-associated protein family)
MFLWWHFLVYLFIGGLAGWITGQLAKGSGYGCIGDIVVGIIGGLVGGLMFQFIGWRFNGGFCGSLFTSVIGALVLIGVLRLLTSRR